MNKHITFSVALLLTTVSAFTGCYVNPTDVGRNTDSTFEMERRKQEEVIRRQQEVIERQQRELKDIERQRLYDDQLKTFDPK